MVHAQPAGDGRAVELVPDPSHGPRLYAPAAERYRSHVTNSDDTRTPVDELSYEEAIAELETITDAIESGEIGLERSVLEYERGVALIKRCRELLEHAEQRIDELSGDDLLAEHDEDDDADARPRKG
ncbi:MAG: hypothetical protein Tsb0013_12900 [Phycisphaerales bacterium]